MSEPAVRMALYRIRNHNKHEPFHTLLRPFAEPHQMNLPASSTRVPGEVCSANPCEDPLARRARELAVKILP